LKAANIPMVPGISLPDEVLNLEDVLDQGYPAGIGAEVFNFEVLEDIWQKKADPYLRDDFSLFFYDYKKKKITNPDIYSVGSVQCPDEIKRPELVLGVDTPEDYQFIKQLYEDLFPHNPEFTIKDIINWYDSVYSS